MQPEDPSEPVEPARPEPERLEPERLEPEHLEAGPEAGPEHASVRRASTDRAYADEVVVAGEPPPQPRVERTGTGIIPAVVIGFLLAIGIVIFVAQNNQRVELEWLFIDFETSPGVLVLIATLLGIIADAVIGLIVRRERRRRLNEREELERLRSRTSTR